MRVDDQHAKVPQLIVSRRGKLEPIGDGIAIVWPRKHIERQGQVIRRSRHRSENRKISIATGCLGHRRRVAAQRDQPIARFVAIYTAERGGAAN